VFPRVGIISKDEGRRGGGGRVGLIRTNGIIFISSPMNFYADLTFTFLFLPVGELEGRKKEKGRRRKDQIPLLKKFVGVGEREKSITLKSSLYKM